MNNSITLGGGCFWCIEAVYKMVNGILDVESGYAGGHVENPDYHDVTTGTTGHAEVVRVKFDPEVISLEKILTIFFKVHDPTTLNRQGNDVGPQYRSAIFYNSKDQKKIAEQIIQKLEEENVFDNPIVTEINELEEFYPAEDYHQDYFEKNPNQGYCQLVINPKITKFEKEFSDIVK